MALSWFRRVDTGEQMRESWAIEAAIVKELPDSIEMTIGIADPRRLNISDISMKAAFIKLSITWIIRFGDLSNSELDEIRRIDYLSFLAFLEKVATYITPSTRERLTRYFINYAGRRGADDYKRVSSRDYTNHAGTLVNIKILDGTIINKAK